VTDDLIKRCQNGEESAFEELIRANQNKIYAVCLNIVGNETDALDCAQETFIKIYKNIKKFRGDSAFSTWAYRLATNSCLDFLAAKKRHTSASIDDEGGAANYITDGSAGVEETVLSKIEAEEVRAAINNLPEDARVAITLRDIRGLAYEEIAEILGVAAGTVKSRISRARALLAERLLRNPVFDPYKK